MNRRHLETIYTGTKKSTRDQVNDCDIYSIGIVCDMLACPVISSCYCVKMKSIKFLNFTFRKIMTFSNIFYRCFLFLALTHKIMDTILWRNLRNPGKFEISGNLCFSHFLFLCEEFCEVFIPR